MNTPSMKQQNQTVPSEQDEHATVNHVGAFLRKYASMPSFLPAPLRHVTLGYLFAPLLPCGAAFFVYFLLFVFPEIHFEEAPILFSVILVSLCWGLLPGLISSLVGIFFFIAVAFPPHLQVFIRNREDLFSTIMFAITCLALSLLTSQLQRARIVAQNAREEAEEANRLMDDFISIVAHELRTPLTAAKASIQLALRRMNHFVPQAQAKATPDLDKFTDSMCKHLKSAVNQLDMQNRLVRDLLDASRVRTNRLEIRQEYCNLVDIVRHCVESQRLLHPERIISWTGSPAEEIPLDADADRVGQVLTNYLTNALKYSDADKPVSIDVTLDKSQARVAVHDQGPGLTWEQQQHIWERFYRAPGIHVRSGSGVGLGLGLYICRSTIERQGGQVGVRSTPGQGSTFWFTLPLIEIESDLNE